jgi:hypothetical protein
VRTLAEDLIGDVSVVALGIPGLRDTRGPHRRGMAARVAGRRTRSSSAPGFRPVHRSPSRRQAIALQSQPLRIAHLGILWGFSDETTNDELTG